MRGQRITILCSGVALGVYIPALLLEYQLRQLGLSADVVLIEDLYDPDARESLESLRSAFHDRFELAQLAQRMTKSMRPRLAARSVDALLQMWLGQNRRRFIVWSGFWMPILQQYRAMCTPERIHADICRIDATTSPSFKGQGSLTPDDREVWFWNWQERRLEYELPVSSSRPVPFDERDDRLVIHGGGWGLGEYREVAQELQARSMSLDRVVYQMDEVQARDGTSRSFMILPRWRPWRGDTDRQPEFPPFGEVTPGSRNCGHFSNREQFHELFPIIRRSRAIISKPGGGTLMDSLAAATPVVFLKPYGDAEQNNANLWEHLGFGVPYNNWKSSGFDVSQLEQMSENLSQQKGRAIDYAPHYARRLRTGGMAESDKP